MKKKLLLVLLITYCYSNSYSQNSWVVTATDTTDYHSCFVGNGIIGICSNRAGIKTDEVYVNGLYDCVPGGYPSLISFYKPLNIDINIKGLGNVQFDKSVANWKQSINLKTAILHTSYQYGKKIAISSRLMALRNNPMCAMNSLELEALEDVELTIENNVFIPDRAHLKGNNNQTGYKKYQGIPVMYSFMPTLSGQGYIAGANTYYFSGKMPELQYLKENPNNQKIAFNITLKKGKKYTFTIVSSITHSNFTTDPLNDALRSCGRDYPRGFETIIEQHEQKWAELWENDIEIEGDEIAQRDVRIGLYTLYSSIKEGSNLSIPPCGLSKNGWGGHIFWDAELWMYPALLIMKPGFAKSMLEFRSNTINQCKKRAVLSGYNGVMFPWESDMIGNECTPTSYKLDMNEHHVTADVGIAFWNYYLVTQDKKWLQQKGYPMMKEIADFWASRATIDKDGKYHILNVIGPDEFHENIDDNAFTNGAAITCLLNATKAATILNELPDKKWQEVADKLVILKSDEGHTLQYKGYKGETIKQADVNLLSYPLNLVTGDQITKDLNYYEGKISKNCPAMAHCVLATIYSRLGNTDKAYDLFQKSYTNNYKSPFFFISETSSATSTNMTFCTGYGGMLQTVLYGFAGLRITENGLTQEKSTLPKQWKSLTIKTGGKQYKVSQ